MLHLALLVALAGAPDVLAFKLDRPAPDLEECRWAAAASDGEQKVEERRVQATDRVLVPVPTGRKLADFAGWVVVVTRLDLADRVALTGRLASLYDLAVANEDRQLFVLALGAEAD
ncbi:MAG: hypothetical protein IT453_22305, partial [Planctomycetes bacterium]|nr:hypothetical protein [Planctomycetota bacterium]